MMFEYSSFDMTMDVMILNIAMYKKIMTNLLDDGRHGGWSSKRAL